MGRKPCSDKEGLNRGAWSAWEDKILTSYIEPNGEGKWRDLPQRAGICCMRRIQISINHVNAGLNRCGKSYRLRWFNYLRPDIKRGNISSEEEELIIRLHKLLGNRYTTTESHPACTQHIFHPFIFPRFLTSNDSMNLTLHAPSTFFTPSFSRTFSPSKHLLRFSMFDTGINLNVEGCLNKCILQCLNTAVFSPH
ncbi:unnamed protein product [Malus baccata var. baccata]